MHEFDFRKDSICGICRNHKLASLEDVLRLKTPGLGRTDLSHSRVRLRRKARWMGLFISSHRPVTSSSFFDLMLFYSLDSLRLICSRKIGSCTANWFFIVVKCFLSRKPNGSKSIKEPATCLFYIFNNFYSYPMYPCSKGVRSIFSRKRDHQSLVD